MPWAFRAVRLWLERIGATVYEFNLVLVWNYF